MITKPTKYTPAVTLGLLQAIWEDLEQDKPDKEGKQEFVYLGQLLTKNGLYKELYSTLANKYADNRKISKAIKRIDSELESRAVVGGMKGKLTPAVVIFHLKNNYKWTDQQQINVRAESGSPELTEEQIKKIASRALTRRVLVMPSSVKQE